MNLDRIGALPAAMPIANSSSRRRSSSRPRDARQINGGLMDGIESGKYFEIYDKWFGPKGELPYPMSPQVRSFMLLQVVPK